ncbi:MAG TPA: hypothetical protein VNL96_10615, partial [Gemmatimonadaceae bacterium]|nr:hypothetical protein [Gemmatimonadaceae bacterium]
MRPWLQSARCVGSRLAVILLLVATLSSATYAIAVSPLEAPTTELLRRLAGAPQPPPACIGRLLAAASTTADEGG